jgi:hypothetical protein
MKCHFANDSIAGKVLIPGCWSIVNSGNIEDCTCEINPHLEYINQLKSEGKMQEAKEYRKIYNEQKK